MPRPYDLHYARIIKSDDLDNDCAKLNGFWHNRSANHINVCRSDAPR
jgi:hypothetical protein